MKFILKVQQVFKTNFHIFTQWTTDYCINRKKVTMCNKMTVRFLINSLNLYQRFLGSLVSICHLEFQVDVHIANDKRQLCRT